MINKASHGNEIRHLTLRIANIKFSVLHPRKKNSSNAFLQEAKAEEREGEKARTVSRNSFIPSTSIRSQLQVERAKQFVNTPLFPVDVTYSKFPLRRPKSIKPRAYFPVSRERLSCTPNERPANLSQHSFEAAKSRGGRVWAAHSRAATKSCLALNPKEKEEEAFVRYSHINSQDCSEGKPSEKAEEAFRKTCL